MMMSEMVKRVAVAIADNFEGMTPELAHYAAVAAIQAMREPTKAMMHADGLVETDGLEEPFAINWRAMIDAALD